jgi:hypothetical protein
VIDLARPRTLSMTETPEFNAYTRRIHDIFRATGVLAEDETASSRGRAA